MPLSLPSDSFRPTLRSLDDVVAAVEARAAAASGSGPDPGSGSPTSDSGSPSSGSRLVVGIAGSPGSGKSTLGADLVARLNRRPGAAGALHAALLPMDGFHLPQARLVDLGRRHRMGAPDTFDVDALVRTLQAIRADAGPVPAPTFDRSVEEPVADAITIDPAHRLVVVEGNYLLLGNGGWAPIAPLLDVSLFVDVDYGIRLARLVARHERFGKSPADALAWATGPDEANARVIEATAAAATFVVRLG